MSKENKKGGKKKWIVIAIIVILVIAYAIGDDSGSESVDSSTASEAEISTESSTTTETTETEEETTEIAETEEKTEFGIGEIADIDGVQVSLLSVTESEGGDFIAPDDGNIFVICEFEITNNSDDDVSVSSMMSFEAYCDDYSISQDILGLQAPEAEGKGQLDGSVAAGRKMNGIISYQVPKEWKKLEVIYSPSLLSSNSATFITNK